MGRKYCDHKWKYSHYPMRFMKSIRWCEICGEHQECRPEADFVYTGTMGDNGGYVERYVRRWTTYEPFFRLDGGI